MEDGLDPYWPIARLIMLFLLCIVVTYNEEVDHSQSRVFPRLFSQTRIDSSTWR